MLGWVYREVRSTKPGGFFFLLLKITSCCRLYEKLAVNSRRDESAVDGVENEVDSKDEPDSEQARVEGWKEQIESRIGVSAFQQASQLLEAVTRTLDGLEDGLVKHAEVFVVAVNFDEYDRLCLNE